MPSSKAPLFVRSLTEEEMQQLQSGLRSSEAFTLRRCQILLSSHRGHTPRAIAGQIGCGDQTVRNVIRAFHVQGLACLTPQSRRPHSLEPVLSAEHQEAVQTLLHQSPRQFGKATSVWTLPLLAEVVHEKGLTPRLLSGEAVRQALVRMGIVWKRAKKWIESPDPAYARKKGRETD